jgi:hypothetical protein
MQRNNYGLTVFFLLLAIVMSLLVIGGFVPDVPLHRLLRGE